MVKPRPLLRCGCPYLAELAEQDRMKLATFFIGRLRLSLETQARPFRTKGQSHEFH
jgi:hypothetical protein